MNKQMIVVAVAGALAASSVMADTVNVNVYGRMRGAVEMVSSSGAKTGNNQEKQLRAVNNLSVLGFKGTEDLGDGLTAMWQAEGAISADGDTDGKLNSRNTFFALKDTWGTVLVGKNDTPYKLSRKPLVAEIFEDSTVQMSAIFAHGLGQNFYTRQSSTIQYLSPVFSGFDFKLGFAPDETKTSKTNKTKISVSGAYNNDMLFANLAYESRADETGTAPNLDTATATSLNGGYKFGKDGSVGLGFEKIKAGSKDQTNVFVSANYKFAEKYVAAINFAKAGKADGVANTGATMVTVGGQYEFSKRTSLSAYASVINNQSAATYNFGENSIAGLVAGKDAKVIGLGFTQKF